MRSIKRGFLAVLVLITGLFILLWRPTRSFPCGAYGTAAISGDGTIIFPITSITGTTECGNTSGSGST